MYLHYCIFLQTGPSSRNLQTCTMSPDLSVMGAILLDVPVVSDVWLCLWDCEITRSEVPM